jgi:hypothetical protein
MVNEMELHVVASLLRRGHSLDQLSTGLSLLASMLGLAQWLLSSINPWLIVFSTAQLIVGLLQKYWAFRVAFDADLFQRLADSPHSLEQQSILLDQALTRLNLQPAGRAGRPWNERILGALNLLRRQALLLAIQVLLTLGVTLASPWLVFAG